MHNLKAELEQRKQQHLYRRRRITESPQAVHMRIDGADVTSFCSNDYLGLANDPDVVKAFQNAANEFGVGSGAAHLVNGHSRYHHELEEALADFTGRERALLFSTGYMANLGIAQAILETGDAIFEDRLNHASLLDAGLLSKARLQRYPHLDTSALEKKLQASRARQKLIMTDAVFSMDGDIASLPELVKLSQKHDAWLMVDDAHGFGTLGKNGAGTLEHFELSETEVPILMGTLGKASGTAGAFVAGSDSLIEYLIQTARSYIYTTAMPAAIAAATLVSLEKIRNGQNRRDRLKQNIQHFRKQADTLDLPKLKSETAIQGIVLGSNKKALKLSESLFSNGLLVTAIRPPTVPEGTARLRITLSAAHSSTDIDRLIHSIAKSCKTV